MPNRPPQCDTSTRHPGPTCTLFVFVFLFALACGVVTPLPLPRLHAAESPLGNGRSTSASVRPQSFLTSERLQTVAGSRGAHCRNVARNEMSTPQGVADVHRRVPMALPDRSASEDVFRSRLSSKDALRGRSMPRRHQSDPRDRTQCDRGNKVDLDQTLIAWSPLSEAADDNSSAQTDKSKEANERSDTNESRIRTTSHGRPSGSPAMKRSR